MITQEIKDIIDANYQAALKGEFDKIKNLLSGSDQVNMEIEKYEKSLRLENMEVPLIVYGTFDCHNCIVKKRRVLWGDPDQFKADDKGNIFV